MKNTRNYARIILRAQKLINEGIVILDAGKKNLPILFINKGFKKITGLRSNKLLSSTYEYFINENSSKENINKFKSAINNKSNAVCDLYLEKQNRSLCYCRISISHIPDEVNKAGYYILVVRDITEARKSMLNEMKLEIVNTTLRSVNDIVFNFMNGLQLFRINCEENCQSPNINFKMFDKQYNLAVTNLKRLNDIKEYKEKKLSSSFPGFTFLAAE